MATRVLSSEQGKASISRIQQILVGELSSQIKALNTEGTTLSDPNVWDGALAEQFRGEWPTTKAALDKAAEAVEQLRTKAQTINTDIMAAGGNS